MRRTTAAALAALCLFTISAAAQKRPVVPTPASVLGFEPGADRKLPSWAQVVDYFQKLDAASPRISVRVLGKTTLGRPFIAAFIGDSATLRALPKWRAIQQRLADARLRRPGERDSLVMNGIFGFAMLCYTKAMGLNPAWAGIQRIVVRDRVVGDFRSQGHHIQVGSVGSRPAARI